MIRVPLAPAAVLAQLDAVGIVSLRLVGLVVAPLALLAGEGHSDANVSTGHADSPVVMGDWFRAEKRRPPGRRRPKDSATASNQAGGRRLRRPDRAPAIPLRTASIVGFRCATPLT